MAGTIVADIIQSDQSYASSINIASPMVVSNTLTMGAAAAISGNVNFDSGTLFVDSVNNRVGIGTQNPATSMSLDVRGNMRLGDGVSVEQDITYVTSGSGTGWQVGVNDGALSGANQYYVYNNTATGYFLQIDSGGRVTTPYQPYLLRKATGGIGQSIPNATYTKVTCLNSTTSSVGLTWDATNHRTTVPITGLYLINYGIAFYGADGYLGADPMALIRVNGTTSGIVSGDAYYMVGFNSGAMPGYPSTKYSFMLPLTKDDYVELWVYQDGGGARRLYEDFAYFQISLLG